MSDMGLNRKLFRAIYPVVDWDQYDREVIAEREAAASQPLDVLMLSWAIDEHSQTMADEPIHDEGTCSTDCAGDIAARYARLSRKEPSDRPERTNLGSNQEIRDGFRWTAPER